MVGSFEYIQIRLRVMYEDNDIGDQEAAGGKLGRLTIYWGFTAFMVFYSRLSGNAISLFYVCGAEAVISVCF